MCDHARHAGKVDGVLVDADLLLRGGTIHDGSGAEPVVGDVAVRDGRIVALGKVTPGKIGRYAIQDKVLSLPQAIRSATAHRGQEIRPGARLAG